MFMNIELAITIKEKEVMNLRGKKGRACRKEKEGSNNVIILVSKKKKKRMCYVHVILRGGEGTTA